METEFDTTFSTMFVVCELVTTSSNYYYDHHCGDLHQPTNKNDTRDHLRGFPSISIPLHHHAMPDHSVEIYYSYMLQKANGIVVCSRGKSQIGNAEVGIVVCP